MNSQPLLEKLPTSIRRRPVLLGAALVAILAPSYFLLRPSKSNGAATSFYEVKRGDFTVTVVEGGTLAAVKEVSVRSEVEGTARIISIVPEGSYAKKGDLLVELDSAQAQDQVNQQLINYEKAKFAVEQSQAQLEIAKSTTNSDFIAADLKLTFAKIDRKKYLEGQKQVDMVEASNKVVQARAQLELNQDTYRYSTNLAAKGYETQQKVQIDWLTVLGNLNSLISASNSALMLAEFDIPKLEQKYDTDVMQAEQELQRVVSQNKRKMAQYEADLTSQMNTLALNEAKLERDKKNLAATRIYAPQDGLVVYQVSENRFSSESLIEGGAIVRNRQELIKLPDLSRMKVTVRIHESHINMISPGLPAYVTLDSAPDVRFAGVVEKVAPLPDTQARWGNPNLKVYNTDIYITDPLPNVKPGVSAKGEIIVTNISDTLSVPIQAVTTFKGKQVAYVVSGTTSEPRPIETGLFNTKFLEITKGLKQGDRVLLSPPFDSQEKDLEGSVLSAEERAKAAATNRARPRPPIAAGLAPGSEAGANPDAPSGRFRGGFSREERLRQFDKDGDGKLNDIERAAMQEALAASRTNRLERGQNDTMEQPRLPRGQAVPGGAPQQLPPPPSQPVDKKPEPKST